MAKETLSVRLEETVIIELENRAKKEDRTLSAYVARLLSQIVYDVYKVYDVHDVYDVYDSKKAAPKAKASPKQKTTTDAYRLPDTQGNERTALANWPNVWLSAQEQQTLEKFWASRGLQKEYFDDAYSVLHSWFNENPEKLVKTKSHYLALRSWPLQRALEMQQTSNKSKPKTIDKGAQRLQQVREKLYGDTTGSFETDGISSGGVFDVRDQSGKSGGVARVSRALPISLFAEGD